MGASHDRSDVHPISMVIVIVLINNTSLLTKTVFKRGRHQMLVYKGYIGHVEFDDDADIFHGEVINTRDIITFQGLTVAQIKKAFRESVDDYLVFCKERNEEPDKSFSGFA
jgi:hypothetical protein